MSGLREGLLSLLGIWYMYICSLDLHLDQRSSYPNLESDNACRVHICCRYLDLRSKHSAVTAQTPALMPGQRRGLDVAQTTRYYDRPEIPDAMVCCITGVAMKEAVSAADGHSCKFWKL